MNGNNNATSETTEVAGNSQIVNRHRTKRRGLPAMHGAADTEDHDF